MKGLKKIDKYLGIADKKAALLSRLNPANANSQKRKFLYEYVRGRAYNPVFKYRAKANLRKLKDGLTRLAIAVPDRKDEQWFFARHLENKRKRIIQKIRCAEAVGTPAFARRAIKLFGKPAAQQLRCARAQFTPEALQAFLTIEDSLSDVETVKLLDAHVTKRHLPWRVKLRKSISSKAGLDSRTRYLLVKTGERFSPQEVASLAVHEIETHIFRKENGALQPLPSLFGEGFAGPPTTEEGLAFYNETLAQHDPRRMLLVSARTIAAALARQKSFSEVFQRLDKLGLPLPYCWNVTLRVKRGISDTSRAGAFTKDHHYLKGYLAVKSYIENGGDVRLLYMGKLNIANAESLIKFGVQTTEPRYLPRHFRE